MGAYISYVKLEMDFNSTKLLNQARAGHSWFLKIDPVRVISMCVCLRVCVCVCVYPPTRLLVTSGVMWQDMDPIRLVKQVL